MRWITGAAMVAFTSAIAAAALPPNPGNHCTDAVPVTVPSVMTGSTALYGAEPDPVSCGPGQHSPSIWFTLMGTGFPVTASTCNDTRFDSILVVFNGPDCDHLQCVGAVDDACGYGAIIQWPTQVGQRYYIVLRGVGYNGGLYTLVLAGQAPEEDCDGNGVPDPVQIAQDPSLDCFTPEAAGQTGGPDGRLDACQCAADWTRDAVVNSTDISGYLTSWLAASAAGNTDADIDCSGATNSTDIATFLARWLAAITGGNATDGCP